jgi:hypothetical protein
MINEAAAIDSRVQDTNHQAGFVDGASFVYQRNLLASSRMVTIGVATEPLLVRQRNGLSRQPASPEAAHRPDRWEENYDTSVSHEPFVCAEEFIGERDKRDPGLNRNARR